MKALVLEGVQQLALRDAPDAQLGHQGAVIAVRSNGICCGDRHVWVGDVDRGYGWRGSEAMIDGHLAQKATYINVI